MALYEDPRYEPDITVNGHRVFTTRQRLAYVGFYLIPAAIGWFIMVMALLLMATIHRLYLMPLSFCGGIVGVSATNLFLFAREPRRYETPTSWGVVTKGSLQFDEWVAHHKQAGCFDHPCDDFTGLPYISFASR